MNDRAPVHCVVPRPTAHTKHLPTSSMSFSPPVNLPSSNQTIELKIPLFFSQLRADPTLFNHWKYISTHIESIAKDPRRLHSLFPHIPLEFCFETIINGETDAIKSFALTIFLHSSFCPSFPVNQFAHSDHVHFFLSLLSTVSFTQKLNILRFFTRLSKSRADVRDFLLENLILERIPEPENHNKAANELQRVKCSFIANCFVPLSPIPEPLQESFQELAAEFLGQDSVSFQRIFLEAFRENPVVVWGNDSLFDWVFNYLIRTNSLEVAEGIIKLLNAAQKTFNQSVFVAKIPPNEHFALLLAFFGKFVESKFRCKVLKVVMMNVENFRGIDSVSFCLALLEMIETAPYKVARLMCRVLILYSDILRNFDLRIPAVVGLYVADPMVNRFVLEYFRGLLQAPLDSVTHKAVVEVIEQIIPEIAILEGEQGNVGELASIVLELMGTQL